MVDKKAIKISAKEFAFANKFKILFPVVYLIIFYLIDMVFSTMFMGVAGIIVNLVGFIIISVLTVGVLAYLMNLLDSKESKFFEVVAQKFFLTPSIFMALLICVIAIILWAVIFIIPGIVYAISVSMVFMIMAERDSFLWVEVVTQGRRLMNGKKLDFILFNLSLIGWYLLSLTIIGAIWALPYIVIANIKYYRALKENYKEEEKKHE